MNVYIYIYIYTGAYVQRGPEKVRTSLSIVVI